MQTILRCSVLILWLGVVSPLYAQVPPLNETPPAPATVPATPVEEGIEASTESELAPTEPPSGESAPAMVERHIFTPGPQPETPQAARPAARPAPAPNPERDILFTGVMTVNGTRRAMIRESGGRGAAEGRSGLYTEGDEVKGMVIKEIGRNYIVLAGEETDQRLNLFLAGKSRPEPPATPETPPMPAPAPTTETPAASAEGAPAPGAPTPAAPSAEGTPTESVFGSAQQRRPGMTESGAEGQPLQPEGVAPQGDPPSNPFLEIMRRAAERREQTGGGGGNPLLDAFGGGRNQ